MEKTIIDDSNFMMELKYIHDEFLMILEELKKIEQETPNTIEAIELLNGRFIVSGDLFPDIIEFIAHEKPSPEVVGDTFRNTFLMFSEIIKEKTRILNNTPRIILETNHLYHKS